MERPFEKFLRHLIDSIASMDGQGSHLVRSSLVDNNVPSRSQMAPLASLGIRSWAGGTELLDMLLLVTTGGGDG